MRKTKQFQSARAAVFIGAVLTVLAAAVIFALMHQYNGQELTEKERQTLAQELHFPAPSGEQQIGVTESILNNDPDHAVSVHYPAVGVPEVDAQILAKVEELQTVHREQLGQEQESNPDKLQSYLLVDYQSYLAGERTASVVLAMEQGFSTWANPQHTVAAMVFDLKDGRRLGLEDVFEGAYLDRLSEAVRAYFRASATYKDETDREEFLTGTAPDAANFQNFSLTQEGVRVYFDEYQIFSGSYGAPTAEVPYTALAGALRIRTEGPTLSVNTAPQAELTEPELPTIDPDRPMIALTFDDGPHPKVTPRILDLLKQYNARATFFVLGNRVDSYADVLQREYTEGHEIGNHSYNHPSLTKLNAQDVAYQVKETDERIAHLLPSAPVLLRPPYGAVNDAVKASVQKPFVLWSIDTLDWKSRNRDAVVREVVGKVKDGDIVLMHDLYSTTADACAVILPALAEEGYQFVTVSQLLAEREIVPAAGLVYARAAGTS